MLCNAAVVNDHSNLLCLLLGLSLEFSSEDIFVVGSEDTVCWIFAKEGRSWNF